MIKRLKYYKITRGYVVDAETKMEALVKVQDDPIQYKDAEFIREVIPDEDAKKRETGWISSAKKFL